MKRLLAWLLCAALLLVLAPACAEEDTVTEYVVNCEEWVSLREKADVKSKRLTTVPLGAEVTVYARSEAQRALAECLGCRALESLPDKPEGYSILFNTVPAPLLPGAADGALNIELASAPGGFRDASGVVIARGPPGKAAPLSAAEALLGPILAIIREEETP